MSDSSRAVARRPLVGEGRIGTWRDSFPAALGFRTVFAMCWPGEHTPGSYTVGYPNELLDGCLCLVGVAVGQPGRLGELVPVGGSFDDIRRRACDDAMAGTDDSGLMCRFGESYWRVWSAWPLLSRSGRSRRCRRL